MKGWRAGKEAEYAEVLKQRGRVPTLPQCTDSETGTVAINFKEGQLCGSGFNGLCEPSANQAQNNHEMKHNSI